MKPRLHTYGDTSSYRTGTGWKLRRHHKRHSRVGGNWLDMSCSIYAADRGLTAKKHDTAVSSNYEPVGVCLTLKEAAFRLHVCRRTLEREIAAQRFPRPVKIGRSVRVPESDLQAYLAKLRSEAAKFVPKKPAEASPS
jgi:excisionase family DNA binding protein